MTCGLLATDLLFLLTTRCSALHQCRVSHLGRGRALVSHVRGSSKENSKQHRSSIIKPLSKSPDTSIYNSALDLKRKIYNYKTVGTRVLVHYSPYIPGGAPLFFRSNPRQNIHLTFLDVSHFKENLFGIIIRRFLDMDHFKENQFIKPTSFMSSFKSCYRFIFAFMLTSMYFARLANFCQKLQNFTHSTVFPKPIASDKGEIAYLEYEEPLCKPLYVE